MRKEENTYTKSTFHGSDAEIKFITIIIIYYLNLLKIILLKAIKSR